MVEQLTQNALKGDRSTASKVFHVHHEFRAGKEQQWWGIAQAAIAPGGGWNEVVTKSLEAGFFNHSFPLLGQKVLPFVSEKSAREHCGGI